MKIGRLSVEIGDAVRYCLDPPILGTVTGFAEPVQTPGSLIIREGNSCGGRKPSHSIVVLWDNGVEMRHAPGDLRKDEEEKR